MTVDLACSSSVDSSDETQPGPEHQAVVRIQAEACAGTHELKATGVAVSDNVVATVAHTFDRASSFHVVDSTGRRDRADIIWLDVERDLALLRLVSPLSVWLPLGDSSDGAAVTVITAAPEDGLESRPATVLQHVAATLDGVGKRAALEIRAEIRSGDSGAPVINGDGEVVGIVFATVRDDNRGWAIAAEEVEAALAQPRGDPISLTC